MKNVIGPEGQKLQFPDDATDEEIDQIVQSEFGGGTPDPTFGAPGSVAALNPSSVSKAKEGTTVSKAIFEEGPQIIGSVGAGIVAEVGGLATIPQVAGLVALGGGAGEAFKQIGQHIAGSLDAPKTSIEAAKRIGEAAITEGGFELLGGYLAKGFRSIIAPFAKRVDPVIDAAAESFKTKIQPILLPAEVTESRILDVLQNISEASLIGGGSIAKFKKGRDKFFGEFADSLIDQFGNRTAPDDLGNLFVTALEAKRKVHSEAANVLYNNVSDLIGTKMVKEKFTESIGTGILDESGKEIIRDVIKTRTVPKSPVNVPTKSLKKFVKKFKELVRELGSIEAKNAGDDLVEAVLGLPDTLSFDAANELRSRLISRVDEFSVLNKKAPAIGKAKRMINLIDEEITRSLKGFKSEAPLEAWRIANQFYRKGQEKFNNTMLRRMVKLAEDTGTGAENIAPAIFKPGQVSKVRKVKRALGEGSEEWKNMKGFFVQHLLAKSTDSDGAIVGKKLLNNMSGKPNSFGFPMMSEILTGPQLREIERFGIIMKAAQARQAEGAGRMVIQLMQFGAVGMIASGQLEMQAGMVLLAPPIIAKLMLNPKTAKLLTKGISTPIGAEAAAGLLSRLAAAAERIRRRTNEK